ncbi:glycosyltransferase family 2 protein [Coraliomargarita sp. SDUM461003]|uniref:Glycosyltransferase family 2 protein n=1 Tax=Thalassobacterium maritimum TaxID=3041265 RepID=A0ABU1AYJ1_9BACT|nr:glycosyltransferase family 2 protein [Coraliomargarita sp. SDUM461003]MDQ8209151.1 glycosyltransferase family 2 protein [Coraliomargarita sp. SDUM461003]
MSHITVVIPVKNEAKNLSACIAAARDIGPIVVVDSMSSDDTRGVALAAGAEVLDFSWDGQFPKKRNWTLRNYSFTTEWVLFLDADEFVSADFIKELKSTLLNTEHVGFWLNFENHFMGKKLRGGDPFRKLALFRVDAGEYERIDEDNWSHLDMEVHEHPVLEGSIGEIRASIEHNDFRGLKHYIAKHNEYSSWEAARYKRLVGRDDCPKSSGEWAALTERQKKKYKNLSKWWFAPAYFIVSYFCKKGFLDGSVGLHFSLLKAVYFYQIRLKIIAADA